MAHRQIITNTLNTWVFNYIESEYEKIINSIRLDIDRFKDKYTKSKFYYIDQFNKFITQLKHLLKNVNLASNKLELMSYIREINELLKKIDNLNYEFKNSYTDFYLSMKRVCENAEGKLKELEIDLTEVYEKILNMGSLIMKRPLIGEINITVDEMERVLEKSGTNLFEFIGEIINNFDRSTYERRSDQLINSCELPNKDQTDKMLEDVKTDLYPFVIQMIDKIQNMNLIKNDDLVTLIDLLNESLGIYIEIEVMEPDVSRDDIYAQIVDVCMMNPTTGPQRRNNLINIGLLLGYDSGYLQTASEEELCAIYNTLFMD